MPILITFSVLFMLIAINALYVAAEFSAVSVRRPRLAQMADDGNQLAGYMLSIIEDPHKLDTLVAACQLGITVSSLVVGFYGQARLLAVLQPAIARLGQNAQVLAQSVAAVAILILLTILQVVLGELVPKNVGLRYPEKLSMITARPMRWSMLLFRPLIWLFNGSGQIVLRLMGAHAVAEHVHIHSPEEIVMLVEESSAGGLLDAEERRLLVNTLQLRELTVRQAMIPRNHMLVADVEGSCEDLFTLLAESPYSRLPLYEETVDNIVGVIHLKELMRERYRQQDGDGTDGAGEIRSLMQPALHMPDSVEIGEVMTLMQRAHHNLVIVVDEYGGTAGMVTFEDLIEEIIGDFEDEFDAADPPILLVDGERILVRGGVLIQELNEALALLLPMDDVNTIGGLVLKEAGETPVQGDKVAVGDIAFRVESVYQHGVAAVSFQGTPEQINSLQDPLNPETGSKP